MRNIFTRVQVISKIIRVYKPVIHTSFGNRKSGQDWQQHIILLTCWQKVKRYLNLEFWIDWSFKL